MIALFLRRRNQHEGNYMKIFISQPMRGRNDDEIKAERAELMAAVREQY